ncbi:hypothetical protein [Lentilactobacillus sp. Marseille-Q4993]|uniref:hypothetical protein n=1 Tax=Lentilactobacillus sp. Marseille-Q4993 TaxID=3039492 RepID=UPI0024BD371E|nr:hypothetical protein [Lentilactobacillus sp. Marseille-Q4993]
MKRNYFIVGLVSVITCLSFTTTSVTGNSFATSQPVTTSPGRQDSKQIVELTRGSLYKKPTLKKATIKVNNYSGRRFRVIKFQIVMRDGKKTRFAYVKSGKVSGWIQVKFLALYC